jgi:hypothetical protein
METDWTPNVNGLQPMDIDHNRLVEELMKHPDPMDCDPKPIPPDPAETDETDADQMDYDAKAND